MFWRRDVETRIGCQISRELLDDYFVGYNKDKLAIFTGNRAEIEEEACRNYLAGRVESERSSLLRTGD